MWRKPKRSNPNGECVEVDDMAEYRTSSYSTSNADCVEVGSYRASSHSSYNGNCVEVGAYRASSHSASSACIEVASGVRVRDSKNREGAILAFTPLAWRKFTMTIREGDHDAGRRGQDH